VSSEKTERQRTQSKQRIKGEFNWKFLYLVCAFATNKDAFRDFLDAFFQKKKSPSLRHKCRKLGYFLFN
jgi:hypothetical protein